MEIRGHEVMRKNSTRVTERGERKVLQHRKGFIQSLEQLQTPGHLIPIPDGDRAHTVIVRKCEKHVFLVLRRGVGTGKVSDDER
jgi:hypothetical protein